MIVAIIDPLANCHPAIIALIDPLVAVIAGLLAIVKLLSKHCTFVNNNFRGPIAFCVGAVYVYMSRVENEVDAFPAFDEAGGQREDFACCMHCKFYLVRRERKCRKFMIF